MFQCTLHHCIGCHISPERGRWDLDEISNACTAILANGSPAACQLQIPWSHCQQLSWVCRHPCRCTDTCSWCRSDIVPWAGGASLLCGCDPRACRDWWPSNPPNPLKSANKFQIMCAVFSLFSFSILFPAEWWWVEEGSSFRSSNLSREESRAVDETSFWWDTFL